MVGVQLVAPPILPLEKVEHGIEASYLVLHDGRAEDRRQGLVAEILDIATRGDDETATARHCLRKPDGTKMNALGETGRDDKACAIGPLRAERVSFVDNQCRPVALAHLHELGERGHVAIGAVEGVNGDKARTMLR